MRNHHQALPSDVWARVRKQPLAVQRRVEHVWQLLAQVDDAPPGIPSIDAAWADLQARLDAPAPTPMPPRAAERAPVRARTGRRLAAALATLTVVLLAGLWGWTRPVTTQVPPSARQSVDLPDGSRVDLNSGSRLQYRRGFAVVPGWPAEQRGVTLHGEAFFDVVRDGRPFFVETFNARIEVLGTRFNVRAWPTSATQETQVTLEEGRVRVAGPAGDPASIVLAEPGQMARVAAAADAQTIPDTTSADLDHVLAWRQGGFVMVRQPTRAFLAELQRTFGVSIEIEDGLVLADTTTLIHLRDTRAEAVIHDFCLAQGCRYRRTSRGFMLLKPDPNTASPSPNRHR